jgi:hypothetical protein
MYGRSRQRQRESEKRQAPDYKSQIMFKPEMSMTETLGYWTLKFAICLGFGA